MERQGPEDRSRSKLDNAFGVTEAGSRLPTELFAGLSTFVTLSYIFIVQPAMLHEVGLSRGGVLLATVLVSGLATIAMGIASNLPFVVAPGMEMNTYFVFIMIGRMKFETAEALAIVVGCGALFVLVNLTQARIILLRRVPRDLQLSLGSAMGAFLIAVGLSLGGVLDYSGPWIAGIGAVDQTGTIGLAIGIGTILVVAGVLRLKGAIIVAVVTTAVCLHLLGLADSEELGAQSASSDIIVDFSILLTPAGIVAVITLFIIDFYGSIAKILGLTVGTPLEVPARDDRRLWRALHVDGAATLASGLMGSSNATLYVESSVGIGMGARTGLASVTCGVLMLLTYFASPTLKLVPIEAVTCVLVYIGWTILMLTTRELDRSQRRFSRLINLVMILVVFASLGIDRAVLVGLTAYAVKSSWDRSQRTDWFLWGSALILGGALFAEIALVQA